MYSIIVLKILDELQGDPWPVNADQRAARCTGTALSIAANLLSACVPGSGGRILAFIGGSCTNGLGVVCISSISISLERFLAECIMG